MDRRRAPITVTNQVPPSAILELWLGVSNHQPSSVTNLPTKRLHTAIQKHFQLWENINMFDSSEKQTNAG